MGVFEAEPATGPSISSKAPPRAATEAGKALVAADLASCAPGERSLFVHDVCSMIRQGYDRVVLLRLARPVPMREGPRPTAVRAVLLLALTSGWPYGLNVVAGSFSSDMALHGPRGHLYGALLSLSCALMLTMAWVGWRYAERNAPPVAELLCASPDRDDIVRWLDRCQGRGRQIACGLAGAVIGVVGAFVDLNRSGGHDVSFLLAYLPAMWTGFLGGGVLYWVTVTAWVPHKLRRCRNLRLTWMDPAHTPGIERLCTCFALVAAGLGFGVITIELSAVAAAADDPPLALRLFLYGFPVGAALLALYAAVLPFVTLSKVVRAYHVEALGTLMTPVAAPPERLLLDKELKEAAEAYRALRSQRTLPVRTWAILQYVTGIVASLIIFFIQQALK
ncbi:hypothetical protein [Actinomadura rudentiformis]|uniref:Uncharacterized protein n=1 Tax=Actinomadura rudentiformis TaxID=359158 RepID=A0A6H9ZAH4_9ACTN|nr:hypothetical protein [Actinomadura rudentiformis]KAB2352685.1 hypothetical protein F8566_03320 [Actinomadura rudentiformis]